MWCSRKHPNARQATRGSDVRLLTSSATLSVLRNPPTCPGARALQQCDRDQRAMGWALGNAASILERPRVVAVSDRALEDRALFELHRAKGDAAAREALVERFLP